MPTKSGEYQTIVDLFFWLYEERYLAKPTWGGEQGRQLKRLIKIHGATEVIDRLLVLYERGVKWAVEPWTWHFFVRHFDSCVRTKPRSVDADSLSAMADKLERDGR